MQFLQDLKTLYQKVSGKIRMKHQHCHERNTKNIQRQSQIKDRQDPGQIAMQKTSAKDRDPDSDRHQHKLVSDRNDHQDHCCHWD